MSLSSQPIPSKIGVIGDIHAEPALLRPVLEFLSRIDIQVILCTGDIVDGSGSVAECIDLLDRYGVLTVRGNHDTWFINNQMRDLPEATRSGDLNLFSCEFIERLPATREFQSDQGRLLLCHGIGNNDMARITPDDYGYAVKQNFELQELIQSRWYRFMVNGHTHQRMVRKIGGLTIINAGTLKQAHDPCFLIVDFAVGFVQFYTFRPVGEIVEAEKVLFQQTSIEF